MSINKYICIYNMSKIFLFIFVASNIYSLLVLLSFFIKKQSYIVKIKVYDILILKVIQDFLIVLNTTNLYSNILGGLDILDGVNISKLVLYIALLFYHTPISIFISLFYIKRFYNNVDKISNIGLWIITTIPIIDIITLSKVVFYNHHKK